MECLEKGNKKITDKDITGIASEFCVLSMLLRIGADATLTLGNKKEVDIIVTKNGKALTIDVKGLRSTGDFILGNHENSFQDKNHYFIFVHYTKFSDILSLPEFFVVPAVKISNLIKERNGIKNISLKTLRESYFYTEETLKVFL